MILIAYIVSLIVVVPAAAHWLRPPKPIDRMTLGARARWLEHVRAHYAFVAHYGRGRPRRSHRHALGWVRRELAAVQRRSLFALDPRSAICAVFHPCGEALSVAACETGNTFSIWASNGGTYLGLFQFGPYARAKYGFAWNAYLQAKYAHDYYVDAGWGPWSCRP